MTADEVLVICGKTIGQPLNPMQRKIGFPREQSTGGPAMRRIAEQIATHGFEPWFVIDDSQLTALEDELGRPICASGDTLFGLILITTCDDEDEFDWLREQRKLANGEAVIDCRT